MSRPESRRIATTFIVRMWTEHGEGQAPQWRGQVEHVQSSEQTYFRTLDHMLEFIVANRGNGQKGREVGSDERMRADNPEGKGDG